jgi:hypothetical protein
MRRPKIPRGIAAIAGTLWPGLALAGGEKATDLVVVADTRTLSGFSWYLAQLYNEDPWMFAVWAVVLTTLLGVGLGVLMDIIMSRIGLDLGKAGHVEH